MQADFVPLSLCLLVFFAFPVIASVAKQSRHSFDDNVITGLLRHFVPRNDSKRVSSSSKCHCERSV